VDLGKIYENLAQSLRSSYVPPYLTEEQKEIYAAAMEDKAYPTEEKAAQAYGEALNKSYELNLYNDNTLYAVRRLGELRPASFPPMWEDLPSVPVQAQDAVRAYRSKPRPSGAALHMAIIALNYGDAIMAKTALGAVGDGEAETITVLHAVAMRMTKDYKGAAKLYKQAVKDHPRAQILHFNAATFHEKYTKDYKLAKKYLDAFIVVSRNTLSPSHEVFQRKDRIRRSKEREKAAVAQATLEKKKVSLRKDRQRSTFERLKVEHARLHGFLTKYASCPAMIELGGTEQGTMILEQGQMVIEAEEVDMAADMLMFYEQINPQLEAIIPQCP